ncbi:MAG: restriction endonuclease [Burkholderiales bacterium]
MIKPRDGSLFAFLLRSPWWVSFLIALGLFAIAKLFLPAAYAIATTLPFLGIGAWVAWKQSKIPGQAKVDATMERLRGMGWNEFSTEVQESFRGRGYEVAPARGVADFTLTRDGYVTLLACKRWKAAQTGVAPLRELAEAQRAAEARAAIYVTAGAVAPAAIEYAAANDITVLSDLGLTQHLAEARRAAK